MLDVKEISFSYKKQEILREVSFSLEKGEIVGLVAPNGTGKTTLLKLMTHLLSAKEGGAEIDGISCKNFAYKEKIFFLENVACLWEDLTVLDHLKIARRFWKSKVTLERVLNKFELEKIKNKPIKKLSLGLKQSVLLMMYVISDAEVLLFDEPINGLDPTNVLVMNEMMRYLKRKGKVIFYSSHNLENLSVLADRILFLKDQKLLAMENEGQISEKYQELFVEEEKLILWEE